MPKKKQSNSAASFQFSPFYRSLFEVSGKTAGLPQNVVDGLPDGLSDKGHSVGFLLALHKCQQDDNPYRIPNEFICARLGTILGLPIAPFALTTIADADRRVLFSSLNFNPGGLRLPRVEADICMQRLPETCVGIVVFDVWMANDDRHDKNLAADRVTAPTVLRVFDHDHTLFGGPCSKQIGLSRLKYLRDRLGITGSTTTGGTEHLFLSQMTSEQYLRIWVNRIQSLHDWMIEIACLSMRPKYLKSKEANAVIEFLIHRKELLPKLIFGELCSLRNIDVTPEQKKLIFTD